MNELVWIPANAMQQTHMYLMIVITVVVLLMMTRPDYYTIACVIQLHMELVALLLPSSPILLFTTTRRQHDGDGDDAIFMENIEIKLICILESFFLLLFLPKTRRELSWWHENGNFNFFCPFIQIYLLQNTL